MESAVAYASVSSREGSAASSKSQYGSGSEWGRSISSMATSASVLGTMKRKASVSDGESHEIADGTTTEEATASLATEKKVFKLRKIDAIPTLPAAHEEENASPTLTTGLDCQRTQLLAESQDAPAAAPEQEAVPLEHANTPALPWFRECRTLFGDDADDVENLIQANGPHTPPGWIATGVAANLTFGNNAYDAGNDASSAPSSLRAWADPPHSGAPDDGQAGHGSDSESLADDSEYEDPDEALERAIVGNVGGVDTTHLHEMFGYTEPGPPPPHPFMAANITDSESGGHDGGDVEEETEEEEREDGGGNGAVRGLPVCRGRLVIGAPPTIASSVSGDVGNFDSSAVGAEPEAD